MQRNLKMARIYRLGDYENLTVEDVIEGLPESLSMNENVISQLQYIQMVRIERMAYKYHRLRKNFTNKTLDEAIELLEKLNDELDIGLKESLTLNIQNNDNKKESE